MAHSTREQIKRIARIYANNAHASRAMGSAMKSFSRLCEHYAVETPWDLRQRRPQPYRREG